MAKVIDYDCNNLEKELTKDIVVKIYIKDLDNISNIKISGIIIKDKDINFELLASKLENINAKVKLIDFDNYSLLEEIWKKKHTYQGFNKSILNKVKQIIDINITRNDYVVDMTCGNGMDTLYLAKKSRFTFGFDIQDIAIFNTKKLLDENNIENYELFLTSHENIKVVLKNYMGRISLILFNLGYLPKGDKRIMTNSKSTLNALISCFDMLKDKGLILMVIYPHPEGVKEGEKIKEYLQNNKIRFEEFHNTNNIYAPYLLCINKN